MDSGKYAELTSEREEEFESICSRCGKCCGLLDDPCSNLEELKSGMYFCRAYTGRLGLQKTLSGKIFNCVPIREHIANDTLRLDCAYNKKQKEGFHG